MTLADCKRTGEKQFSRAPDRFIDPNKTYVATVKTDKGDFKIQLFAKDAPDTVNNFVFLACKGFYDGTTFHRVIPGFVAQGGDPQGSGAGGPGYTIKFQSSNTPYTAGVVGMASRGAHSDTAGSQFFIALTDITKQLSPADYGTFGKVIEGMDVVKQITPRDPNAATTPGDKIVQITVEEQ